MSIKIHNLLTALKAGCGGVCCSKTTCRHVTGVTYLLGHTFNMHITPLPRLRHRHHWNRNTHLHTHTHTHTHTHKYTHIYRQRGREGRVRDIGGRDREGGQEQDRS